MSPYPWLLAAAAVGSAAFIAGPVSAWTRRYVREPFDGGETAGTEVDISGGTVTDAGDNAEAPPAASSSPEYPELKHPGFLGTAPQGVLALTLCSFCAWWGTVTGAFMPAFVALPAYALLGCAASVDAVAHLLPNRLLGATTAWLITCGVVAVVLDPDRTHTAVSAALCALTVGGISLVMAYFRTGLGLGDVKLGAVIGLWMGWLDPWMLVFGLCLGVFLGGIAALILLITRRASRKDSMAYGPYLIAGTLLTWPLTII